jgi:hypothetical protein
MFDRLILWHYYLIGPEQFWGHRWFRYAAALSSGTFINIVNTALMT